jgi:hypothetical protein
MEGILRLLDGKKAKILAIFSVIIGLLTLKGAIDSDISAAIMAILNILAGTAAYATDSKFGKAYRNR